LPVNTTISTLLGPMTKKTNNYLWHKLTLAFSISATVKPGLYQKGNLTTKSSINHLSVLRAQRADTNVKPVCLQCISLLSTALKVDSQTELIQ